MSIIGPKLTDEIYETNKEEFAYFLKLNFGTHKTKLE